VLLYKSYIKYNSTRKNHRKFRRKTFRIPVPHRNIIQNHANMLRTTGMLIYRNLRKQYQILTEEILDNIRAKLLTINIMHKKC
jgi:hypothetical protein